MAEGLTKLTCANGGVTVEACGVVAQLTQLRRLRLAYPSMLADARLRRLSALSRLTSLEVVSIGERCDHYTGSWLAALAAARVPLRHLRLCDYGVPAGEARASSPSMTTVVVSPAWLAAWMRLQWHAAVKPHQYVMGR